MKKNSNISETQEAQLQKLLKAKESNRTACKTYYQTKNKSLEGLVGKKRNRYQVLKEENQELKDDKKAAFQDVKKF